MFLWVALKLNESFANDIRNKVKAINQKYNLDEKALELPAHISLKISFDILNNDKQLLIDKMVTLIKSYLPLKVTTNKIERNGNIIWISIKENNKLQQIHNKLDLLLLNYGISKHEFDDNFMFHSTLFIDENEEKIKEMYDVIKDVDVSDNIKVDSIIMGESEDGINFIPILDIVVKG